MPYIEGQDRMQVTLLPESIDEYIGQESEARVIEAFVEGLNVKDMGFARSEASEIGRPAFRPQDMLKLYLYGLLNRIRSSRKLEAECRRNVEVMWLMRRLMPDYKTIADFRRDNAKPLKLVFTQFMILCRDWDLFGARVVAIDGSKFKACNSKKNNFSDKKLTRQLQYIDEKIEGYMTELEETDNQEKALSKPSVEAIEQRIAELSERRNKYENMKEHIRESGENEISTIDPDARLMYSNNNGVDVSHNVQATVDGKHNMVVDIEVTHNASDSGQLYPMAQRAKEALGVDDLTVLADKGYSKKHSDLMDCEKENITVYAAMQELPGLGRNEDYKTDQFTYDEQEDVYICPQGQKLSHWRSREIGGMNYRDYANRSACRQCPMKDQCTTAKKGRTISRSEAASTIARMQCRMKENPQLYKRRQMMNEPVFGCIKRSMGFTYYLTRGHDNVSAETAMVFCAYNIKRALKILGTKEMIARLQGV